MAQSSSDAAREYWDRMMEAVTPHYGSAISVALKEQSHAIPDAPGESFAHIYLALPFKEYKYTTLGFVKRDGVQAYRADVLNQLRHQTGLRLEKLANEFIVDVSAPLLGLNGVPVTESLCASLKSPGLPDVLDVIKDPWIDAQLDGLSRILKSLPS